MLKVKKIAMIVTMAVALVFGSVALFGCSPSNDVEPNQNLERLDAKEGMTKTRFTHEFPGDVNIETFYGTEDYDMKRWLITDSKTLRINLEVVNAPAETEVFVEHVHADVSLAADKQQLNGLGQDSMDDTFHGTDQPGWYVAKSIPYAETFAIEGYSKTLIDGWNWYCSGYGSGKTTEVRLTERKLYDRGVYGNKVQVAYDLAVKNPGDKYFHTETFTDEFYVSSTYIPPED